MNQPLTDGPRAPESAPAPPEERVSGLIPFVHVEDLERSIAFYYHLGFIAESLYSFIAESLYKYKGRPVWAALRSEAAELMVSTDGHSVDPADQGVLFYLYSNTLRALREQLLAAGIDVGEIFDGTPAPREQMRVTRPRWLRPHGGADRGRRLRASRGRCCGMSSGCCPDARWSA